MILHVTISDVINLLKKADIKTNEFFIAAELQIKGQKVSVHGIINISERNLLVEDGLKISKQKRFKSYGPGTRIASIL